MRAGIRSRPWAGLDIGSYSVKLLALQGGVGGVRFWLSEVPLPMGAAEAVGQFDREPMARVIAEALQRAGLSARGIRGITVGISGADVIIKQIALPLLADDEVGPALRFEARKHLPFDPSGMVIDYQILGRYPSERRLDVLLAAVTQEHIDQHLGPLRLLGIEADVLDAAPLALTNALVNNAEKEREPQILLDIGHTSSHLTLYQRGEPYFTRRLDFGGRTLTQAIADGIQVPFEEAEEWKLAAGSDEPGFKVDWDAREMSAMQDCLRRDLVEDLNRSFAFYRTLGSLPEPFRVWISGGSARLPGLAARLAEMLDIPVLLFNPIDYLSGSQRGGSRPQVAPQFAQAYGLALRTV